MRRTLIPLVLTLVLVFAVAQVAAAAWGQGFGGRGIGAVGWTNLAQELEITAEQFTQIQELQRQHFTRTNEIQNQLRQTRQELRMQRWNPDADPARVQAQIGKIAELRDQLRQEVARYRAELRVILTEEQLAKWAELRRGGPCPKPGGPLTGTPRGQGGPWQ